MQNTQVSSDSEHVEVKLLQHRRPHHSEYT